MSKKLNPVSENELNRMDHENIHRGLSYLNCNYVCGAPSPKERKTEIRILDSVNFLPMKLSKLPEAFGLQELKKGYFPHYYNKSENQNYVSDYPDSSYYGCDSMSSKERDAFLKWYTDQQGKVFDFAEDILNYCRSDVDILRKACLTFQKLLLDITGKQQLNEDGGEMLVGGVDPFNETTIASVCSKVFRAKVLKEKWQIKLQRHDEITDWLPAFRLSEEFSVLVDSKWKSESELQCEDWLITESRFVDSPIAQIPSCGYVTTDQFSLSSIQWLEWIMEKKQKLW